MCMFDSRVVAPVSPFDLRDQYTPPRIASPPPIYRTNNKYMMSQLSNSEELVNGDGSILSVPQVEQGSHNLFMPFNVASVDSQTGCSVIRLKDDLKYRGLCLKMLHCKEVIEDILDVLDTAHFSDNHLDAETIYFSVDGSKKPYQPLGSHLLANIQTKPSSCKSVELSNLVYIFHVLRTLPLPKSTQGIEQLIRRLELCKMLPRHERHYKDVYQSSLIAYTGYEHGVGLHTVALSYVSSIVVEGTEIQDQLKRLLDIPSIKIQALEEILVDLYIFVEQYYLDACNQPDEDVDSAVDDKKIDEKSVSSPELIATKKRSIANESADNLAEEALKKRAKLFLEDEDIQLAQNDPTPSQLEEDGTKSSA